MLNELFPYLMGAGLMVALMKSGWKIPYLTDHLESPSIRQPDKKILTLLDFLVKVKRGTASLSSEDLDALRTVERLIKEVVPPSTPPPHQAEVR